MKNERMIKVVFGAALAALMLAGCGDETTRVTGLETVANLQEAGKCATGDMVLNLEDGQVYVCGPDNKWGVLKGEKGVDGAPGEKGEDGSSYTAIPVANGVEIYCGDQLITTILNGQDGTSGQDGAPGQNCTGRAIDGVGVEISCGGVVVDTLRNGDTQGGGTSSVSSSSSSSTSDNVVSCGSYNTTTHFCDTRDGKIYKWTKIGTQIWMAENLNFAYKKGDTVYGNWCYKDSTKYCTQYGRFYSWGAAMDSLVTGCGSGKTCTASAGKVQGICPDGWHLPSPAEWRVLFAADGDQSTAGTMLKSTTGWDNNGNGEDIFGFSALPSGYRYYSGGFYNVGSNAYFWSSSEGSQSSAIEMNLSCNYASAFLIGDAKYKDCAVRCVKD